MSKGILIIGHAQAGKDTFAEMLHELYGLTFKSSSVAASEIFLYDALKVKYGYKTPEECFKDRVNRRKEWYDLIQYYNSKDKSRLARAIMKTSDMYVGMRSNAEIEACLEEGLFRLVIGVYDSRKPQESKASFKINLWECSHIIVPNNGTIQDLRERAKKLKPLLLNVI